VLTVIPVIPCAVILVLHNDVMMMYKDKIHIEPHYSTLSSSKKKQSSVTLRQKIIIIIITVQESIQIIMHRHYACSYLT